MAIVRQAKASGLDMIAICDHNSVENVAAVARAGQRESVTVIPGVEITTREEVHLLGLFETEQNAMAIQPLVYENLAGQNDENVFGSQVVVDQWGQSIGVNTRLLMGATSLALEQVVEAIHDFGGLAVAAHIDRPSFGLIGQLGFIPDGLKLDALEASPRSALGGWDEFPVIASSDAHSLKDVGARSTWFFMEEASFSEIRRALCGENGRGVSVAMEDLSLHILDIVENSISASASRVEILIVEDTRRDLLTLEIKDDGRGMDEEARKRALDPFFTTRTTRRVGLGLSLLAQAAEESGGDFELTSRPGEGTTVKAAFQLSHPDRKPFGDIAETLRAILQGKPDISLRFEYTKDSELVAELDTSQDQNED
jgi:hypothetical protein